MSQASADMSPRLETPHTRIAPAPEPARDPEGPGPDSAIPLKPRGARACVICNKRKIKCNLSENVSRCDNCTAFDYECIPHERKRKRYALVECEDATSGSGRQPRKKAIAISSNDAGRPTRVQGVAQNQPSTPRETAEFVQAALVAQFGGGNQPHIPRSPLNISPAYVPDQSPSSGSAGYLGRSKYLGGELLDQEDSVLDENTHLPHSSLTADDIKVLEIRKAFDLPSRAACESLLSTFMSKCDPWMPVLPRSMVLALQQGRMSEVPLLVLQAVLMAGARMQTERSPLQDTTAQQLYDRAKVLFFIAYEKDPMSLISAVTILQYWNPSGPGHVSIHNSSYWLRVGVGLVHQMGLHKEPDRQRPDWQLRRRVFWTLYSRDCLLSMGQGRPRAIHLEDCSIEWPTVADFPVPDKRAKLFVAHVRISGILGDLTQWYLRGGNDIEAKRAHFERQLRSWIVELPSELHICDPQGNYLPYDCDTRFLLLPYFTAISILYKPKLPSRSTGGPQPTMASTIASSCVARIFEDALARNEVRNGVAIQAIYLMIAGIGLLTIHDYPLLWRVSANELKIIKMSLEELSKTWQTAKETLRVLQRLQDTVSAFHQSPDPPPLRLDGLNWALFQPFGPSFSSKTKIVLDHLANNPTFRDVSGASNFDANSNSNNSTDVPVFSGDLGNKSMGNDVCKWNGQDGQPEGESPQSLMANLLQDLSAESLFSGEDWFFRDI